MPRRRGTAKDRYAAATQTAAAMHSQDLDVAEKLQSEREQGSSVALKQIKLRQQDTRPLNPLHVDSLQESISALGLLEPLVVDQKHTLLAGGHRLAAIQQLELNDPMKFSDIFPGDLVPVRMMGFDATKEPSRALEIEIAENEHRRDYSPQEVRELAIRLMEQGYVYRKGKPAQNEKPLGPAIEVIIGKHRRTVRRYLEKLNQADDIFADENLDTIPLTLKQQFYALAKKAKRSSVWDNPQKRRVIKRLIATLESLLDD